MSKVISIQKEVSKSVITTTHRNVITLIDFFAPYQDDTNEVFSQFLNELYGHYLQTDTWKELPFGDKAEMDFRYQLLRDFLQQLQR